MGWISLFITSWTTLKNKKKRFIELEKVVQLQRYKKTALGNKKQVANNLWEKVAAMADRDTLQELDNDIAVVAKMAVIRSFDRLPT